MCGLIKGKSRKTLGFLVGKPLFLFHPSIPLSSPGSQPLLTFESHKNALAHLRFIAIYSELTLTLSAHP